MLNYFMEFYLLIYLFSAVIFLLSLPIACGCIYLDIFQSPDVCYQKDLPTFSIPSSREFHLRMAVEWLFSISEAITPFRSKDLALRLKPETFFILCPPQSDPLESVLSPRGKKKNVGRQRCSLCEPWQRLGDHLGTSKFFLRLETLGQMCMLSVASIHRNEFIPQ